MNPDEQAIREVHSTWIAAVNAGDLGCLLSMMSDDVVFLNPGREPFGKDGFPAGFLGAHWQYHLNCISELQDVVSVGPSDAVEGCGMRRSEETGRSSRSRDRVDSRGGGRPRGLILFSGGRRSTCE